MEIIFMSDPQIDPRHGWPLLVFVGLRWTEDKEKALYLTGLMFFIGLCYTALQYAVVELRGIEPLTS